MDISKELKLGANRSNQARELRWLIKPLAKLLANVDSQPLPLEADMGSSPVPEEEAAKALVPTYRSLVEAFSADWLRRVHRRRKRIIRRSTKPVESFEKRLHRTWREPLEWMHILYVLSYQIGAEINATSDPQPALLWAHLHLHARACKVYTEMEVLLKHGLADGAHARWRSLHETAVVALFLDQYGDDGARLFDEHRYVESLAAAEDYRQHSECLGLDPIDPEVIPKLRERVDSLCRNHGKRFKNPYGWAEVLLDRPEKSRVGLSYLEKAVGLAHLRPYYRMASYPVHAGPHSIHFTLGHSTGAPRVRLAGPSNAGLADPAHAGAVSLVQVTGLLPKNQPSPDGLALMELLRLIVSQIGDAAMRSHLEVQ